MTIVTINQRSSIRAQALKNGWRSGLEESLAADLRERQVPFQYEENVLLYQVPSRTAKYTPDFYITTKAGATIVCESKGRFCTADRQKMLLVKQQHPELDIRFVFSNSRQRISKQSQTTYGDWCEKHGFIYATRLVPEEWLNE